MYVSHISSSHSSIDQRTNIVTTEFVIHGYLLVNDKCIKIRALFTNDAVVKEIVFFSIVNFQFLKLFSNIDVETISID